MALVSPGQLPVGIRGNSTGCYRDPQEQYGLMGSSPGVGGNEGCGEIEAGFSSASLQENAGGN